MNIFRPGAQPYPMPVWDAASDAAAAAAAAAAGGQPEQKTGAEGDGNGAVEFDAGKAYAELETDSREWLQRVGLDKSPVALAKHAHNQEKLLGSAIRIPKDDAPQEEKDAFLDKLGRPKTADEYKFESPKELPEGLPYDGELEKKFRTEAHALGLNPTQAARLRDMFVEYQVGAYNGATTNSKQQIEAKAAKATETMEAKWGKLDGDTAKSNFEIADKVFSQAPGGPEALAELKSLGLVGPNKEILSAPIAFLFASLGTALYTEDGVLRGKGADAVGNPFADGEGFNLTGAMKIAKENPDTARSLITAAGKKPSDFGLK